MIRFLFLINAIFVAIIIAFGIQCFIAGDRIAIILFAYSGINITAILFLLHEEKKKPEN